MWPEVERTTLSSTGNKGFLNWTLVLIFSLSIAARSTWGTQVNPEQSPTISSVEASDIPGLISLTASIANASTNSTVKTPIQAQGGPYDGKLRADQLGTMYGDPATAEESFISDAIDITANRVKQNVGKVIAAQALSLVAQSCAAKVLFPKTIALISAVGVGKAACLSTASIADALQQDKDQVELALPVLLETHQIYFRVGGSGGPNVTITPQVLLFASVLDYGRRNKWAPSQIFQEYADRACNVSNSNVDTKNAFAALSQILANSNKDALIALSQTCLSITDASIAITVTAVGPKCLGCLSGTSAAFIKVPINIDLFKMGIDWQLRFLELGTDWQLPNFTFFDNWFLADIPEGTLKLTYDWLHGIDWQLISWADMPNEMIQLNIDLPNLKLGNLECPLRILQQFEALKGVSSSASTVGDFLADQIFQPVSATEKRESKGLYFQGYFGIAQNIHTDYSNDMNLTVSGPLGIEWDFAKNFGVFASIYDIGQPILDELQGGKSFSGVVDDLRSPGVFLTFGSFPNALPLALGAGVQWIPTLPNQPMPKVFLALDLPWRRIDRGFFCITCESFADSKN